MRPNTRLQRIQLATIVKRRNLVAKKLKDFKAGPHPSKKYDRRQEKIEIEKELEEYDD